MPGSLETLETLLVEHHISDTAKQDARRKFESAKELEAQNRESALRIGQAVIADGFIIVGIKDPSRIRYDAGTSYALGGGFEAYSVDLAIDEDHAAAIMGAYARNAELDIDRPDNDPDADYWHELNFTLDGVYANANEQEIVPDLGKWPGQRKTEYTADFHTLQLRLPTPDELAQFAGPQPAAAI